MQKSNLTYEKQKIDFLDSLHPDDLRNAATFNQMEKIIEQLNKSIYQVAINKKDSEQFITKAAINLFRKDSPAIERLINLSKFYLETKLPASKI
ncbi:MAG: hypothetical protein KGQ36_06315 [Rickettsiales bacterium]|nr:hypothetical protein [Rickettsiales bacterium]